MISYRTRRRCFSALRIWLTGGAVSLVLMISTPAQAHDPHEITADIHFWEDRLEVMLTQTHLTALASCGLDTKNRKNFGPHQFAEVKASLEACARGALEFKGAGGTLSPTSVAATFSAEGEIEFRLSYPRPPAGVVKLDAVQLRRLAVPECVLEATVLMDGKFQGHHVLNLKTPVLEITVPARPVP